MIWYKIGTKILQKKIKKSETIDFKIFSYKTSENKIILSFLLKAKDNLMITTVSYPALEK